MGEAARTAEVDDVDELTLLTQPGREEDLKTFLMLLHPADVAELLSEASESTAVAMLKHLDPGRAAMLVSELEPADQERILTQVKPEQLGAIVEQMETDDAADLLQELDEKVAEQVLAQMPAEERQDFKQLLAYDPASAGGLMQTELVSVAINADIGSAIQSSRAWGRETRIFSIFVVDDVGRYAGNVELQDLVCSPPEVPIERVMRPKAVEVRTDVDQEEVARLFDRYSLVEVGVVDQEGRLVGRITADDIHEVLVEEHGEDILKMAGTIASPEAIDSDNPMRIVGQRLPWLIATFAAGLIATFILSRAMIALQTATILLAFVPVITGMSGNVGTQSAMITIRGMALGQIDGMKVIKHISKDAIVGAIMGLVCGTAVSLVVSLWRGKPLLGVCVGTSLMCSMTFASILGSTEPPILRRFGIDPAVAAGPLITSINDITGVLIYTSISLLFLDYLR